MWPRPGPGQGEGARRGRRADRWPAHGRGRVRVREVRPGGSGHQRHRLPGPPAVRRGDRLPGRRRGGPGRGHLRRRRARRRRWSSPVWNRRRSARSSSCGCARRTRRTGCGSYALAPFTTRGYVKLGATVILTVPGAEAATLNDNADVRAALSEPGAILFVGERLAEVPGGLSAAAALAAETGAKLAWVPRRAGDRGAVEAGCLPNLLPGARPVAAAAARAELESAWALDAGVLPGAPGRDTDAILRAARTAPSAAWWWPVSTRPTWPIPAAGRDGTGAGRVPGQHRTAAQCRVPARGRGVPDRPGGREGRRVRGLGGPGTPVRRGAAHGRDERRPGTRRAGRRDGCRRWAAPTYSRCAASSPALAGGSAEPAGRAARYAPRR